MSTPSTDPSQDTRLKIGAVANSVGVSVHTIRKWEERYGAVNPEKLSALSAEDFTSLRNDGSLAGIFAHVFSLDLWNDIMRRREARRQARSQDNKDA